MCEAGLLVSELLAEATVAAEIQHVCEARESGPRTGAWVGSCQRHCWSARVRQGALRVSKCPKMCTILNTLRHNANARIWRAKNFYYTNKPAEQTMIMLRVLTNGD